MSIVTKTDKRKDLSLAFDEACDAVSAGRVEDAERILVRAFPQPQATHVLENIVAVFSPKEQP